MSILYRIWGIRKITLVLENFIFNLNYRKTFSSRVVILGLPIVSIPKGLKITCGKNLLLISDSYFSEPGVNHPVMIRLLSDNAKLTIGNDVGISGGGICVKTEVVIGNGVMLGANAFVTDTDFHPIKSENRRYEYNNINSRKVVIEDNVFIGMNSLILKGVTIGKNSVIAAGSIVSKDVPANQIWGGNPAKFIKEL